MDCSGQAGEERGENGISGPGECEAWGISSLGSYLGGGVRAGLE